MSAKNQRSINYSYLIYCKILCHMYTMHPHIYASVGGVVVCVCVCVCVFHAHFSATAKNCNASVSRQYLRSLFCKFQNQCFVVQLWRDLLTLTPVTSVPKSSEDQTVHSRLLFNQTVASVPQARQQHTNSENETVEGQLPSAVHLYASSNKGVAAQP